MAKCPAIGNAVLEEYFQSVTWCLLSREKKKSRVHHGKRCVPFRMTHIYAQRRTRTPAVVIDVGRGRERAVFLLRPFPPVPNSLRDQTPRGEQHADLKANASPEETRKWPVAHRRRSAP